MVTYSASLTEKSEKIQLCVESSCANCVSVTKYVCIVSSSINLYYNNVTTYICTVFAIFRYALLTQWLRFYLHCSIRENYLLLINLWSVYINLQFWQRRCTFIVVITQEVAYFDRIIKHSIKLEKVKVNIWFLNCEWVVVLIKRRKMWFTSFRFGYK